MLSTPTRKSRKNKSKSKKNKSQNKSRSRRTITKAKAQKSGNKSQRKRKSETTPTKKQLQKSNRKIPRKRASKKLETGANGELPLITLNHMRNSGQSFGVFEVNLRDREHKKKKYAKEKKVNLSNLVQNKKRKKSNL